MAKEEYLSNSAEETKDNVVHKVLAEISERKVNLVLLQGNLGAGKTTFAQGLLGRLGAEGPYISPTFVIMKRYSLKKAQDRNKENSKFKFVYHFDCYRVGANDMLELGWEEILADPSNLVLVEWPEKIENILPKNVIKLNFEVIDETRRKILITR